MVLVGDDPASHIYVRNKEKACKEVGIKSFEHLLPATIPERELLALVHQLNKDKDVMASWYSCRCRRIFVSEKVSRSGFAATKMSMAFIP